MNQQMFRIVKINPELYSITGHFSDYIIKIDKVKGIGIYMCLEDSNTLIKSYKHTKIETALMYLLKKDILN